MRILVVIHGGAGSRVTGPEIRGWAVAQALSEQHDVTVALHDPPGPERDGIRLVPFTRRTLLFQARRHDAILAPVLPPYLFAAVRGSSTITISDQYDPVTLELSVVAEQPGIARVIRAQRMIREAQLRFADIIACANERQRALLLDELAAQRSRRAVPPQVVTVPFGLPEPPIPGEARPLRERFPQIGPDAPVVLWWGKVWKWFDATTAIRAFDLVLRRRPDACLVITAGKSPKAKFDRSERVEGARALSAELGLLGRSVFFLDEWTPYDRRHEYLQDADIGLTLHGDTAEAPFAARARYMDYLWSALPCVLTSGDDIADRFGAAGFARLVRPGDPGQVATELLRLIDSSQARQDARDAGRLLAEQYRWPKVVRPLADAIDAVAGTQRRSSTDGLVSSVGRYYARRTVDSAIAFARSEVR